MDQEVRLSLSEFLDIIKSQFDDIIGYHHYTIEAEVKSIKQNRNFYYIDLVETENGQIKDSVRSHIFNPSVMKSFLAEVGITEIEELAGKKLLLNVKPSFHKTYNFSVNILKIYSEYFIGGLEKQKKEDIEYLQEQDIFHLNTLTDIGEPRYRIAVITGEKSEGYRDFQSILEDSGFLFDLVVFPSLVHGEKARSEVKYQLEKIRVLIEDGETFNAVAIIRGGGGSEGMNWTNDRLLCEQVCHFPIPVISAVGHTVDQSILDMVSKYDCKTPSEAAQMLIGLYEEMKEDIESEYEYILGGIEDLLKRYSIELEQFSQEIPFHISKKIQIYKKELEGFIVEKKVLYHLQYISQELKNTYKNIEYNNPHKILAKGYSLTLDKEGKVVKRLSPGQPYILVMDEGKYKIEVVKEL